MRAIGVIARLTFRELLRRKLLYALLLVTVLTIGLTAWGFHSLLAEHLSHGVAEIGVSQVLILVMFTFSGIVGLTAIMVAAGTLSGDVESGVILAVLARPVTRAQFVMGKWVGVAGLVLVYAAVLTTLEFVVVFGIVNYTPPYPVSAGAALVAQSLVLATLTILLSTRMAAMTSGILASAGFFMAWLGGEAGSLAPVFHNNTLKSVGLFSRLILPSDGLWRTAVYNLEPKSVLALVKGNSTAFLGSPFVVVSPPTAGYLIWIGVWFLGILMLGLWSFGRRQL